MKKTENSIKTWVKSLKDDRIEYIWNIDNQTMIVTRFYDDLISMKKSYCIKDLTPKNSLKRYHRRSINKENMFISLGICLFHKGKYKVNNNVITTCTYQLAKIRNLSILSVRWNIGKYFYTLM